MTEMMRMRPKDQREHAEHVCGRGRDRVLTVETFSQRVERARADVAVDDPEAGETEQEQAALMHLSAVQNGHLLDRVRNGGN